MCRQACAEAAQKCQIRSMSISCGDISLVFLVGWRCLAPRPGACVHIWDALWQLLSQSNSALHLDLHLNFSTYRIFFVTIFTVAFCPHVPLEIPVLFYLLSFDLEPLEPHLQVVERLVPVHAKLLEVEYEHVDVALSAPRTS